MLKRQLLIYPPISKPCEPPASLSVLSGCLNANKINHKILDLNIECFNYLLNKDIDFNDNFEKRAIKNLNSNLSKIRCIDTFKIFDKYKKVVLELNKKLSLAVDSSLYNISFSDFQDLKMNPFKSSHLKTVFNNPQINPFFDYFSNRIDEVFKNDNYELIGISINYLSQALCGFAIAGNIKKKHPNLKVVIGGGLCSSWLQFREFEKLCLELGLIPVKGPGERALLELSGLEIEKYDFQFTPNFKGFDLDSYFSPYRVLPFMAEKGCYYGKCRFCPERAEGNRFGSQKVDMVIENLKGLIEVYKPGVIHFLDNAISPKVLKKIAEINLETKWYGFVRVTKELESLTFCKNLKKSGCSMLQIGIESGSDYVLKKMEKGINIENVQLVLDNLKKVGIKVFAYFLFGSIWEDESEAMKTIDFINKNTEKIDYLNLAIFNLPKFSPDSEGLITFDFYEGDLSLYDNFKHPKSWNRKKVRKFLNTKLKEYKKIGEIAKKTPPYFTSNHASFFDFTN